MKSHLSTQSTIKWRHAIHPELQCGLLYQLKMRGTHQEPHESVRRKIFPKHMNYVTQQTRVPTGNLMRKRDRNNLTLLRLSPAV